jgi:hypothetical protein
VGRCTVAVAALSLLATHATLARADDDSGTAMAEALFLEGKALLDRGHTPEACDKLAASQHLDPQIGTLLYLATCHETQGKTATAWAEFNEGLAELQRAPNPRRAAYARQHVAALSAKLSRLVLHAASPAPGLEVKVDGKSLDAATLGTPLPLDPGPHEIDATAPHRKAWSTTVDVGIGAVDVPLTVPALEFDPSASSTVVPSTPPATPPRPAHREADVARAPDHTFAYVAGAVGIAGVVVGAIGGIAAISDKRTADDGQCKGSFCTAAGLSLYSQANTWAWVSTGAFVVGVAGLGLATYLLVFDRPAPARAAVVQLSPTLGGFSLSGTF